MRYFKIIKALCFVIFLFVTTISQAQDIFKAIGNSATNEGGATIVKGPSGDYYVGGYHENEAMVARLTNTGEVVWIESVDFGDDPDYVMELKITSDNFLIGCGNARTGASFNAYGFAFKLDLDGNLLWSRTFVCDDLYMWANGISESSNGNYRVVGSYKNTRLDNYMIEFDNATGTQLWDSIYARTAINNSSDESFYAVASHPTNNADYVCGRFQLAGGMGTYRPTLTKFNADGAFEWSKSYLYNSSPSGGRFYAFGVVADGDSLVMSLFCKNGATGAPFQTGLIKTDLDGNIGWAKLYTAPGIDLRCYNVCNTGDGYLLAGWDNTGDKSLFLIRTDAYGNELWAKTYGGGDDEDVYAPSSNGRVIVDGAYFVTTGRTASFTAGNDIFLVKGSLETGELTSDVCGSDLTIVETNLPVFQEDYLMVQETLPIVDSNPDLAPTAIDLIETGLLVEAETDTAVGGDTLIICTGEAIELEADWSPTLDFLWSTGETTQSILVSETGMYSVEVSLEEGCVIFSDSVYIAIEAIDFDLGEDTLLCNTETLLLDPGFFTGADYLWQDGATDQTYMVTSAGTYWVNIENEHCSHGDTIVVNYEFATVDLGPDTTICIDETLLLDAAATGLSYEWHDGSDGPTYLVDLPGGLYAVTVSTPGGCSAADSILVDYSTIEVNLSNDTTLCASDEIMLDPGFFAGAGYLWQDGTTDQTYTVIEPGTYWVSVADVYCTASDTITITYDSLTIDLGNDTLLCQDEVLNLDVTTDGGTYLWTDGTTAPVFEVSFPGGIIGVMVEMGPCSATDSILVDYSAINADLPGDTLLCDGEELTLEPGVFAGATYTWQDGSTGTAFTVNVPGEYSVLITDGICSDEDEVNVEYQYLEPHFIGEPLIGCAPLSVNFTDLSIASPEAVSAWEWNFGDATLSYVQNPIHLYTSPGLYDVTLTVGTSINCAASLTIADYIEVVPSAVANFTFDPETVNLNEEVVFTNYSENSSEWLWEFGDLIYSNAYEPQHSYTAPGEYWVTLIAYHELGCNDTISKRILAQEEILVYVPNIFTPDGDNFNQVWGPYISGIDIYDFHLTVFNRWGEIVWESYNSQASWDGSYGGKLVQDGVYVWVMEYGEMWTDKQHTLQGHLTVLK